MSKRDLVQLRNPRTGLYVKIDKAIGAILSHKKSPGPYKGIPIHLVNKPSLVTTALIIKVKK